MSVPMSKEGQNKYGETETTEIVEERRRVVRGERLLDCPAVGTGAAKQASVVTLPAATAPAGREHLWMAKALISAVLRHALSQHARLHLLQYGEGLSCKRAKTFTPLEMQSGLVFMPSCDFRECSELQAL